MEIINILRLSSICLWAKAASLAVCLIFSEYRFASKVCEFSLDSQQIFCPCKMIRHDFWAPNLFVWGSQNKYLLNMVLLKIDVTFVALVEKNIWTDAWICSLFCSVFWVWHFLRNKSWFDSGKFYVSRSTWNDGQIMELFGSLIEFLMY